MRLAAEQTHGVLVCLQSLDAGGKDGTIRHVMSGVNPQGVRVSSFKVPSAAELGPRLPVALRPPAARPGRDRHLQPVALRGGPRGARPPRGPGPPEAAGDGEGRRHLGPPLPRDQRLGALPGRQRDRGREALPEPLQGGATDPLPQAASTSRSGTGSSRPPTPANAGGGTTTRSPSPGCCRRPARSTPRGTSSRPTTSGSPASAPGRCWPTTLIDIDPQFPTVDDDALRDLDVARQELVARGAGGRRARPVRRRARRTPARPSRTATARRAHVQSAPRATTSVAGRSPRSEATVDTQHALTGTTPERRRVVLALARRRRAGPRGRPRRRPVGSDGRGTAARERPECAPRGAAEAGLAALPRAVPQLHADHPGRRRGGVAPDRRVGHRRPPARADRAQRGRSGCARRARPRAR